MANEQLTTLKNLVKEAKYGEYGVKVNLTPSEIKAIEWSIRTIESNKNSEVVVV